MELRYLNLFCQLVYQDVHVDRICVSFVVSKSTVSSKFMHLKSRTYSKLYKKKVQWSRVLKDQLFIELQAWVELKLS